MADSPPPRRIEPRALARDLRAGRETLLVCAYENDASFAKFPLAGAIPLSELVQRLDTLERERELVFYCRCPGDETALAAARRFRDEGFENTAVLAGGVVAWRAAGLPEKRP